MVMGLTTLGLMLACSDAKTPQEALTKAFEALEANNVEEWNKTLLNSARDPNEFRDLIGMQNFKKLVGVNNLPSGQPLNLSAGNSREVDSWGQLGTIYEVPVLSGNPSSKIVAIAKVGCNAEPRCAIIDFLEADSRK